MVISFIGRKSRKDSNPQIAGQSRLQWFFVAVDELEYVTAEHKRDDQEGKGHGEPLQGI
jgi:hypothetical protein